MHALELPPELTDEIFSYFVENPDYEDGCPLKAVSMVCRHWREVSVRRLFKSIQYSFLFDDDPCNNKDQNSCRSDQHLSHIHDFVAFLEDNPLAASAIHYLSIRNAEHGKTRHHKAYSVKPEYLYTALKLLPSLCHLFLTDVCFTSAPNVTKVIHLKKLALQHSTTRYVHRFADVGHVLSMFGTLDVLLVSNVQFGFVTPPAEALAYLCHLRPNVLRWEATNMSQDRFFATMYTILGALHASGNVSYLQDLEVEIYSELGYIDKLLALVRKFVPHVEWLKCRINDESSLWDDEYMRGHTVSEHSNHDSKNAKDKDGENSNEESSEKSTLETDLTSIDRTPLVKLRAITFTLFADETMSMSQLETATHLLCLLTQPLKEESVEGLSQRSTHAVSMVSSDFRAIELRLPHTLRISLSEEWSRLEDAILQLVTNPPDAKLRDGMDACKPAKEKVILLIGTKDGSRNSTVQFPATTKEELQTLAFKRLNERKLLTDGTHNWSKWEVRLSSRNIKAYRGSWLVG